MSRKEIIKVPKNLGLDVACVPRTADDDPTPALVRTAYPTDVEQVDFEERWTGSYIFENEWQSFRTRKNRELELISAPHTYTKAGRYTMAVKVIDIFGNDTMTLVPVSVG